MKVFGIIALVCFATAIQENGLQQGDISMVELPQSLQETSLGRAILSLASLQAKSQQVEFGKLFAALDELESSITESREEEQSQFQSDYNQYSSDITFYQNQVTQFKNEVAQHEVDLAELQDKDESLTQRLESKRKELAQYKQLRSALDLSIQDNANVFQGQQQDYTNAISSLDQAIELVEQLSKGSFIEVERFEGTKDLLKEHLSNFAGQRVLYQPLIEALVQMSQSKFSNQRQVQQVLSLLRDLRKQLSASKLSLVNSFEAERDRNNALAGEYDSLITSLADTTIPQIQQSLENNHSEIQAKNNLANDASENLKAASDNFDATETAWVKRQADNTSLKKQYDNELLVIAQARTALERGGVKKQ